MDLRMTQKILLALLYLADIVIACTGSDRRDIGTALTARRNILYLDGNVKGAYHDPRA